MKSYLEQALEQAEQKIDKGDFRKGLVKLDDACWNVTAADSIEEFDRIRGLAEHVAERADGRLAKKARALVDLTEERRTAYLEGRVPRTATVPVRAYDKPRAGCGVVALGAILGAFVGGIVGAVTYAPDPFFGRGFNFFVGMVIGLPIGACVGLVVAAAARPWKSPDKPGG